MHTPQARHTSKHTVIASTTCIHTPHALHTCYLISYTHTHHEYIAHTHHMCILCMFAGSRKRGARKSVNNVPKVTSVVVNQRVHKFVTARLLKGMSRRGRCVACYARSVASPVSKKRKLEGGTRVPTTTRACNVCRKLLCSVCFRNPSLWSHSTIQPQCSVVEYVR